MTDVTELAVHRRDDTVLTFRKESFSELVEDIKALLPAHYEELAAYHDIPLDPDFRCYEVGYQSGHLRFYTARLDGRLIGYVIMTVVPHHAHYRTTGWAIGDIVLIAKEHRRFGVGNALFEFMENDLANFDVIQIGYKHTHPELAMLLQSRGYVAIETIMSKRLHRQ
jgi:GNAT superfamily N-acetyltransferase